MTHGTTQSMMTLGIQANLSGKNLKISRNALYFVQMYIRMWLHVYLTKRERGASIFALIHVRCRCGMSESRKYGGICLQVAGSKFYTFIQKIPDFLDLPAQQSFFVGLIIALQKHQFWMSTTDALEKEKSFSRYHRLGSTKITSQSRDSW